MCQELFAHPSRADELAVSGPTPSRHCSERPQHRPSSPLGRRPKPSSHPTNLSAWNVTIGQGSIQAKVSCARRVNRPRRSAHPPAVAAGRYHLGVSCSRPYIAWVVGAVFGIELLICVRRQGPGQTLRTLFRRLLTF